MLANNFLLNDCPTAREYFAEPTSGLSAARPTSRGRRRNARCGPVLHGGKLIFAVVIVNVPMARLRLFPRLRRRFACWRLRHRSTPLVRIAIWLGLFPLAKPDRERGSDSLGLNLCAR
jgi:hypothetical protein